MRGTIVLALWASVAGCHLSHERATTRDAGRTDSGRTDSGRTDSGRTDSGRADAGAAGACRFSVETPGGTVDCTIPIDADDGCTRAALCTCADAGDAESIARCAGWELTPRGALTFADFCTREEPARATMLDAIEGYFAGATGLTIDGRCDAIPATIGRAPYEECAAIAGRLCLCLPEPCSVDRALGRTCVDATLEEVACITAALPTDGTCPADLAAIGRACAP